MKWRTVLCTALFLCGTVLLSACGGGEVPAPAEPPASSEVSAPSQPEEVPAPSESASSSEPEPLPEPEPPKPWDGMVVPEGCKAEWRVTSGVLVLMHYDTGDRPEVILPTGKPYRIQANCFENNHKIVSVTFPADVIEIGQAAFAGCSALRQADFSKSGVRKIEQSAFQDTGLICVTLPEGLSFLGKDVFSYCRKLEYAEVHGVETVSEQTFNYCSSLKTVVLGTDVIAIDKNAFNKCDALETVYYNGDWEKLISDKFCIEGNDTLKRAEHRTKQN